MTSKRWHRIGGVAPTALSEARRSAHWAAQLASAPGTTLTTPAPDFSHTNLEWLEQEGALAGERIAKSGVVFRAALRVADTTLLALDGDARVMALPLHGRTLTDGLQWLGHAFRELTGAPPKERLRLPDHPMPDHPIRKGASFPANDAGAREELGRWFSNAASLLEDLAGRTPGASPVRCWPHHFDIATLIALDPDPSAEGSRSVGAGLSPGDDHFAEPYWYVSPYPSDSERDVAPLPSGAFWNRDGFFSAVLRGTALADETDATTQLGAASDYLAAAVEACFDHVGKRPSSSPSEE